MTRLSFSLALLLACSCGCGGDAVSKQDLAAAREAVQAGLDAWKKGVPVKQLETSSPAVQFSDDDWQAGSRLVEYEVLRVYGQPDGNARCSVKLTLRVRGKTLQKETTYQVALRPRLIVARDPYA